MPAVILISGSGPQDRDNTAFKTYKPFKEIAEYLSTRGIAVLRVDDRGIGKNPFKGNGYFNPHIKAAKRPPVPILAEDVQAGLAFLKTRREINPNQIGLLGNSLGGVVAPAVAAQSPVAFIISMAGPVEMGKEQAIRQVENDLLADKVDTADIRKITTYFIRPLIDLIASHPAENQFKEINPGFIRKIRANVDSLTFAKVGLPAVTDSSLAVNVWGNALDPVVQESLELDPSVYWRQVRCPSLALFATKDVLTNALYHASLLQQILKETDLPTYQISILSGLNHGFREAKTGSRKEDSSLKGGISRSALALIYSWIIGTIHISLN